MHRRLTGPLTIETVAIPIRNLPQSLTGCRIVQLSDFHFDGKRLSPDLLNAVIHQVNALDVDLVALTGDYVTTDPSPIFGLTPYLKRLQSRFGTVAVLGNHDNRDLGGRLTILRELRRAGVYPLWNGIATPLGDDLPIIGLADFWSREFAPAKVLDQLPGDRPRIVLSHNPDTAEILKSWRVDLQLSGHTHGGQIVLPILGAAPALAQTLRLSVLAKLPIPLPYLNRKCIKVVRHWEWASGLHRVGQNWLYVNRGLGTYAPGRFRCPPEISVLQLVNQG
jgi:predicted MPP superfamily phosphohydrolase